MNMIELYNASVNLTFLLPFLKEVDISKYL